MFAYMRVWLYRHSHAYAHLFSFFALHSLTHLPAAFARFVARLAYSPVVYKAHRWLLHSICEYFRLFFVCVLAGYLFTLRDTPTHSKWHYLYLYLTRNAILIFYVITCANILCPHTHTATLFLFSTTNRSKWFTMPSVAAFNTQLF